MNNSEQDIPEKMNFYEQYSSFTDAQLLDILQNHKDYQKVAVDAAVKIAIERQLIHSEQDLLAPEFQKSYSPGFTLFPDMTSDYHRQRLMGSIFRVLFVISLLPIIYGFLKYGEGLIDQTYIGVGVGVIWFLLCLLLKKTRKPIFLIPLFTVLILVSLLIVFRLSSMEYIRTLDVVMLVIGILLPAYLLTYLKKLIRKNQESN